MDFFVFLFLGITIVARILNLAKKAHYNYVSENKHPDQIYYFDHRGIVRFKPTGECCYFTHLDNGDRVLASMDTLKPIYNLTRTELEEKAKESKQKAIEEGKSVYLYDNRFNRASGMVTGRLYRDVETDEEYIIRLVGFYRYYIKTSDFSLVRIIDEDIEKWNLDNEIHINRYYNSLRSPIGNGWEVDYVNSLPQ